MTHSAEKDVSECDHVAGYYTNPHSGATCWDCGAIVEDTSVIPPGKGDA